MAKYGRKASKKVERAMRERSGAARSKADEEVARSLQTFDRISRARRTLARSHDRRQTMTPPVVPPQLVCPQCDRVLTYDHSHIGGVSERHSEQWDYFTCAAGCGMFQYRQRTRKLRKV